LIVQPAIGGVLLGLLLLIRPEVMGVGYDYVDQALNGTMVLRTLVILCALKMVATIVSYSSGNAGGIFAPTLFIGAMAGGAIGALAHRVAPFPMAAPGAYALVGMGTLFAGIIRAPMTSVFMVFEITQDYQILVPLMVANLLSFVISRRFQPVPVYHALLQQDGIHLPGAEAPRDEGWTVRNVMRRPPEMLAPETTIASAAATLSADGIVHALVGSGERLLGIVTRAAVVDAAAAGRGEAPLDTIVQPIRMHVHPDHRMDVLFERWKVAGGLLPVVGRDDDRRLEGVITIDEITSFLSSSDLGELEDR
jgi:CIC family chloride channel protein